MDMPFTMMRRKKRHLKYPLLAADHQETYNQLKSQILLKQDWKKSILLPKEKFAKWAIMILPGGYVLTGGTM